MSELDVISQIARKIMIVPSPSGNGDNWLWDRTLRILRNVELISRLPELAEQAIAIDRFCLVAAVYFADSGVAHFAQSRKAAGRFSSSEVTNDKLCQISVQTVSDVLTGVITDTRIDKINKIITGSFDRFTEITEAMVLSDGRGLEDLGVAGLLGAVRGQIFSGKGVSDILESWNRKVEYGYWQARLQESFRFTAVRQTAKQRFAAMEQFINQLDVENTAGDLEEQLTAMLENK